MNIGFVSMQVVISVEDLNDNLPFFEPESYPVFVSENTMVGTTVIRVMAFDNDIGSNAELTYSILLQSPGDVPGQYTIVNQLSILP